MRAVTGTITTTRPSSIAKAGRILLDFERQTLSGILSSEAATYLRTAIEAVVELHQFHGHLRDRQKRKEGGGESERKKHRPPKVEEDGRRQQREGGGGGGGGGESERKHRPAPVVEDGRRKQREGGAESERRQHRPPPVDEDGRRQQREDGAESERRHVPAPVDEDERWEPKVEAEDEEYSRWEPKVEEEEEYRMTFPAAGEKKSSDMKGSRGNEEPWEEKQGIAAPDGDLHSPASEKRRKKKEKRVKEEAETGDPIVEQSRKSLDSGKKKKHLKQEDFGAKEAEEKMVHVGVAENGLASEEKRRKKRKHTEEKEVKKEAVDNGDLGSDKKRKKKRGRDGDTGNDAELVEHTKKKQRK